MQQFNNRFKARRVCVPPVQVQGQQDVLPGSVLHQQVKGLEHKAHPLPPQQRARHVVEGKHILSPRITWPLLGRSRAPSK